MHGGTCRAGLGPAAAVCRACLCRLLLLALLPVLLGACGGQPSEPQPGPVDPGPVDPGPVDPGPVDPDPSNPDPSEPDPIDPDPLDPVPGLPAEKLIQSASFNPSTQMLSFSVDSRPGLSPLELELELPPGVQAAGSRSFSFPGGFGSGEVELLFDKLGQLSSPVLLKARETEEDATENSVTLAVAHPRLELDSSYDPASHVLTVSAVHPYAEAVTLRLEPTSGLKIDGPLEYTFQSGVGSRAFPVVFSNPQITSGRVELHFSAPRSEDVELSNEVSLARIFEGHRWLLPENVLRLSLSNGYDDSGELPLSVTCSTPAGIEVVGSPVRSLPSSSGELDFQFSFSGVAPASWNVQLKASDSLGRSDELSCALSRIPPLLPPGALQVYPLTNHAEAGQAVRFMVATGPTPAPLLFMSGVALSFHPSASYELNSFNIGEPGGLSDSADGVWADCNTSMFITGIDQRYSQPQALLGERKLLVFNITPLKGQAVSNASGALFSFELSFSQPGTYSVEVLDRPIHDVPQTYFANQASPLIFWQDISGRHPGVPFELEVE